MLKGIDISYYQRKNYKDFIKGADFVICRAAFSKYVDEYCDTMYQYAKSEGKKLGFYFFPLTSDGTPEDCAKWAYDQVRGYIGEAIPMLDWESYSGQYGITNPYDVEWAYRWLKKFEALSGVKPMIYMNSSLNRSTNWQKIADANYGLWIANYGNNDGTDHGRPEVKYWKFAAIHQYTSKGADGVGLDRDVFYGDEAAWDKYCGKKTVDKEPTPKPIVASCETYTVKRGDTLSGIAKKYGTTYQKIAKDNGIENPNLIFAGMKLKIYK